AGHLADLDAAEAHRRAGLEALDRLEGRHVLGVAGEDALLASEEEDDGGEEADAQHHEDADADPDAVVGFHQSTPSTMPQTKLRTSGISEARISSTVPLARIRWS